MKNKTAIIVFQKNEIKGQVKTRIAKTMGDTLALEIYRELVDLTYKAIEPVLADVILYFSDFLPEKVPIPTWSYRIQNGKDLGERMSRAFCETFQLGYEKVIILGTDCPLVSAKILQESIQKLEECQVVIGPAEDGGYYLLGMKSLHPELFVGINWSTSLVFQQTVQFTGQLGLSYQFLARLSDVDTEEDWQNYLLNKQKFL